MTKTFETIVSALQAGTYSIRDIRRKSWFEEEIKPITDEAELFSEAFKTLLYYFCLNKNDHRYHLYYDYVLIPNEKINLPKNITLEEILSLLSES